MGMSLIRALWGCETVGHKETTRCMRILFVGSDQNIQKKKSYDPCSSSETLKASFRPRLLIDVVHVEPAISNQGLYTV
jgi:hypothetical protein